MWPTFVLVFAFASAALYLPGYLFFRGLRFARIASVAIAPIYTLCVLEAVAFIPPLLGMPTSGALLIGAALLLGLIAYGIRLLADRAKKPVSSSPLQKYDTKRNALILCLFVGFALVVGLFVYVKQLDGAAAFAQEYDNYFHLGVVRSFLDSGNYSLFNATLYPFSIETGASPWGAVAAGYCPALWHMLTASIVSVTGCPLTLGVNAVDLTISAVLFPTCMFFLLRVLFKNDTIIVAGAFAAVGFTAFPWGLIMYGPLFPNLLGFSLLPLTLSLIILAFAHYEKILHRLAVIAFAFAGLAAMALAHPNTIFSAGVLVLPFLLEKISRAPFPHKGPLAKRGSRFYRFALVAAGLVVAGAVWIYLYKAPFLQSVVNFSWQPIASKSQAVMNLALTQLTVQSAPQVILSAFILAGIAYILVHRKQIWLLFSLAFAAVIYFACACASTEGMFRHLFAGFWYNDIYRIAAMYALAAIPIASAGIAAVYGAVAKATAKLYPTNSRTIIASIGVVASCALLLANYAPNHNEYGNGAQTTSFGILETRINEENNFACDMPEKEFAAQVKEIVGNNLVLNDPFDGSAFLYGADGLNVYYRQFYKYEWASETDDSKLIRSSLADYATDLTVQAAVADTGAQYVLLLDNNNGEGTDTRLTEWDICGGYEYWQGFYSITDDTPGFEPVLASEDMRLYKIVH